MEKVDLGYNLYEKMSYEQDYYRQWLLSQPPEDHGNQRTDRRPGPGASEL